MSPPMLVINPKLTSVTISLLSDHASFLAFKLTFFTSKRRVSWKLNTYFLELPEFTSKITCFFLRYYKKCQADFYINSMSGRILGKRKLEGYMTVSLRGCPRKPLSR